MDLKNLGIKAYNFGVKKRNKLVRGDYNLQGKGRKAVGAAAQVSHNIVADLSTGDPQDMFPFKTPQQERPTQSKPHRHKQQTKSNVREVHHYHHYSKPKVKKRRQRQHEDRNPFFY